MAYIETVTIDGFWGSRRVVLRFRPDVNFLIGKNGSGKTTAIEIIASALQMDEDALERLPFSKIEISLVDRETKRKPRIIVEKLDTLERGGAISYRMQKTARASVDEATEYLPFLARGYRNIRDERGRIVRSPENVGGGIYELKRDLSALLSANWLSINRISPARPNSDRLMAETLVDRKTREISDRLERYFSELSSASNLSTRNFQRKFFRSLIQFESVFSLSDSLSDMDLEGERKSLTSIFEKFSIPPDEYRRELGKFYAHLTKMQREKLTAYSSEDLVALINAQKIHLLVNEWNAVVAEERKTLLPRDAFVQILDNMFHRKKAEVLPSGEMNFKSQSGKDLKISDLSSGEKQPYIILGEALLQRDAEWTYLADEPELSLHVDWQEVLVDNLRALNPNGQVIFATHSPDIVSHFSDCVIDMEGAIQ